MKKFTPIPIGYWGKKPMFRAKVGTGPSNSVIILRKRRFYVGQIIRFATSSSVRGQSVGTSPQWISGRIYTIKDGGTLFIELL